MILTPVALCVSLYINDIGGVLITRACKHDARSILCKENN